MKYAKFEIENVEGKKFYGNSWLIDEGESVGSVILVHGMLEYSKRYEDFAKELVAHGYNVYALDHIGHGMNAKGKKGIWPKKGFEFCVDNLNELVHHVELTMKPIYLIGHSMGSFMCQRFMERCNTSRITGVVLVGTNGKMASYKLGYNLLKFICFFNHKNKPNKFLNKLAFGNYNKKVKNKKTEFDWLSYNEENVNKYVNDEDCGFVPSTYFFFSLMKNLVRCFKKKNVKRVRKDINILILGGEDDPVGNYGKGIKKLQTFYAYNGICSTAIVYPHMRHEILNEDGHEKVYNDILNFMSATQNYKK